MYKLYLRTDYAHTLTFEVGKLKVVVGIEKFGWIQSFLKGYFKWRSKEKRVSRFHRYRSLGTINRKIIRRYRILCFLLNIFSEQVYPYRKFFEWYHHKRYLKKPGKKDSIWMQIKKELGFDKKRVHK